MDAAEIATGIYRLITFTLTALTKIRPVLFRHSAQQEPEAAVVH